MQVYSVRLSAPVLDAEEIKGHLRNIFDLQTKAFKFNASLGVLLRNVETVSSACMMQSLIAIFMASCFAGGVQVLVVF